jgi:hypothetical protein
LLLGQYRIETANNQPPPEWEGVFFEIPTKTFWIIVDNSTGVADTTPVASETINRRTGQ